VLRLSCPLKIAVALAALDGNASRLFLLSTAADAETADELIRRFDAAVVLTDAPFYSTLAVDIICWASEVPELPPVADVVQGECDTLWTLATSGTTNTPKLVAHRLDSLTRTTKVSQGASSSWRWGLLFEPARFAGLQVMLQGLLGGGGLIALDPETDLNEQVRSLAEAGCTALSATPTMWRKLLMTSDIGRLELQQVTLGGEIADDAVLRALAPRFRQARITNIYA
jgi:acyl-CoA synthetase (AMP-forming)/AMP-acid ligase II